MSRYIVGITGASGSIYALKIIKYLLEKKHEVHLVFSNNGEKVFSYETGLAKKDLLEKFSDWKENLIIHDNQNLFSSIASGSYKTNGMVIAPCSMSTLGEIAQGVSKTLLGRAADVCLKENRKLILVPRETPFNSIHLRNMLTLSESGAIILPAMPAFYNKPETLDDMIDFVAGRILSSLGIENTLYREWGSE